MLFVVNKSEDAKEIELYLSTLLDLGCEDFHFFGRHSNAWGNACDILDIKRRPEDDEIISLTSIYDSIDGFSESLLISNEFVCVFYDDAEVMQKLVQRIISN